MSAADKNQRYGNFYGLPQQPLAVNERIRFSIIPKEQPPLDFSDFFQSAINAKPKASEEAPRLQWLNERKGWHILISALSPCLTAHGRPCGPLRLADLSKPPFQGIKQHISTVCGTDIYERQV
ncbi:MAG: hypothetical protein LBC41_08940 [Clostridiales bacterium]|nr:hypothetical protein [Clostridiales bacterium]